MSLLWTLLLGAALAVAGFAGHGKQKAGNPPPGDPGPVCGIHQLC